MSSLSLASSDSCSLFLNTLSLIFLQNQSLGQAVLFQAVVVWLGREESCRVSWGPLCPSDPTAVLIFASPSGFAWLLSLRNL